MTDACLMNPTEASTIVRNAEPELIKRDKELTLIAAREYQSLKHTLAIKYWLCVWDNALDKGCAGTVAIQQLVRFLATPAQVFHALIISSSASPYLSTAITDFQTPFLFCPKVFLVYCMLSSLYHNAFVIISLCGGGGGGGGGGADINFEL